MKVGRKRWMAQKAKEQKVQTGQVFRWSGGHVVRWSGGQVILQVGW